ncbi:hypothetical protein BC629DRAFT_1638009 [Irpex lacteus]|nr:hypothetical protein BC629DRAFT_1638009 [Irpex lacteus]
MTITMLNNLNQRDLVLAGAFAGLSLVVVLKRYTSYKSTEPSVGGTKAIQQVEKSPLASQQREPGEWNPVSFDYPTVAVCADEPGSIKPIPYRPFKWGEYHVTMGIRSMPWDEWFELDNQFADYHRIREHRIRTRGDRLVQVLPTTPGLVKGGHDAATELVQEMAEYLSRRFPTTYTVKRREDGDASGWYGHPAITEITIVPVGKTYIVEEEEPMTLAGIIVQDDIAIMIEGSDGQYYLQAGAIVIPGMWRLQDKIGMSLDDIHISGTVPQFQSKLQPSMNRYFRRMSVDKPVTRTNYSFQVVASPDTADPFDPDELSWAKTMKGDEEDEDNKPGFLNAKGGNESKGGHGPRGVFTDLTNSTTSVDPSHVRAIVFGIRTYLTPLEDLASEPEVPGRLASAIRSWPEDVAVYKARAAFESVLGYLDERHAAQVAAG